MLAPRALVLVLAVCVPGLGAFGQEERTAAATSSGSDTGCPDNMYPIPSGLAGMTVANAQAYLDGMPGSLNIAIADRGSCESLREPTAAEMSAIIMGPASPCGNPGTSTYSGGLVGVVLMSPIALPLLQIVVIAALTAAIVAALVAFVVATAVSRTRAPH